MPVKKKTLKSGVVLYIAWGYDGPPPIPRVYLGSFRDRDDAVLALKTWNGHGKTN